MKTWTTKDGQKLKIQEMGTDHIKNCIKMLEDQIETLYREIPVGYDGMGEMAQDMINSEISQVERIINRKTDKVIAFREELKKRGEL